MHAIILAGGFATRLWPLTENTAKPLIEVAGKPLISYIIESLPLDIKITISTNLVFADDFIHWKNTYFADRSENIDIFIEDSAGETEKRCTRRNCTLYPTTKNTRRKRRLTFTRRRQLFWI